MTKRRLAVSLSGGRGYDIHFGEGLLCNAEAGEIIGGVARSNRAVIITQPNLAKLWAPHLAGSLETAGFEPPPVLTFPKGERYKNLKTINKLCQGLYALAPAIDRKTLIIALGGGVVGDVAGFVASIYLRGLDYVQVPTTLLAMVDSSVGGKTGVDFQEGKNLVGAFHQPRAVCIDMMTLASLPLREIHAGMAEIVKYGVVREPEILPALSGREIREIETDILTDLVYRSCAIKAEIVTKDEYETTGLRAILNYGHTIGHALESVTQYRRYKHGEAVAIGMMAAAAIGEVQGITPPDVRPLIGKALRAQKLPDAFPVDIAPDSIFPLLARDKKAEGGKARFVLARALGDVTLISDVDEAAIREGLRRIGAAAKIMEKAA